MGGGGGQGGEGILGGEWSLSPLLSSSGNISFTSGSGGGSGSLVGEERPTLRVSLGGEGFASNGFAGGGITTLNRLFTSTSFSAKGESTSSLLCEANENDTEGKGLATSFSVSSSELISMSTLSTLSP